MILSAFWEFFQNPQAGKVYNIGGSRHSNCSVLEAIQLIEQLGGRRLNCQLSEQARAADHVWWISDVRNVQADYPQWSYSYDLKQILGELLQAARERLLSAPA